MSVADITERELQVIQAYVDAEASQKLAAIRLGVHRSTVANTLARARVKAGVRSNISLVIRVRRRLRGVDNGLQIS